LAISGDKILVAQFFLATGLATRSQTTTHPIYFGYKACLSNKAVSGDKTTWPHKIWRKNKHLLRFWPVGHHIKLAVPAAGGRAVASNSNSQ
jgi:hypothetical protein